MGRHAFAEGLLQFLSLVAWVSGAAGLLSAALMWEASGILAVGLALGTVVATAALLALCQVGLVIIDVAGSSSASAEALRAAAERRAAPPPAPVAQVPAAKPALTSPGEADGRRWQFLKEADPEVAEAAARAAELGPAWEAALAERVLSLGTSYLPGIVRVVTAEAAIEAQRMTADEAALAHLSDEARQRFLRYRADVQSRNGVDPSTLKQVVSMEPYQGRWVSYAGGVKVALADGTWMLLREGRPRTFKSDPDLDV